MKLTSPQIAAIIDDLATELHGNSAAHGFWEDVDKMQDLMSEAGFGDRFHTLVDGEKLALQHSEISEALEVVRKNPTAPDRDCPEFTALEIEQADAVIRILDFAKKRGLRIGGAIIAKAKFNKNRPYKHGKKS